VVLDDDIDPVAVLVLIFVIVLNAEDVILLVVIELIEGFGEELDVLDTVVDLVAVFVPVLVFVLVPLSVP
jgi:hypothetical protein